VAIDTTAVPARGTPVQVEFSPWLAPALEQGARGVGWEAIPDAGTTAPVIVTATRLHRALPEVPGGAIVIRPTAIATLPAVQPGLLLHMIPGHHLFDATGNQSRLVASPRGFTAAGEGEYLPCWSMAFQPTSCRRVLPTSICCR